jgi:hypothetical protein
MEDPDRAIVPPGALSTPHVHHTLTWLALDLADAERVVRLDEIVQEGFTVEVRARAGRVGAVLEQARFKLELRAVALA